MPKGVAVTHRSAAAFVDAEAQLFLTGGDEPLGPDVSIVAFRTIQESLTNVIRHSKASHVSIRAALKDSSLHLLVADDGCGFEVGQTRATSDVRGGAGLSGMRERIQLFGGTCTVTSAPGEGVQIRAKLPLRILEAR